MQIVFVGKSIATALDATLADKSRFVVCRVFRMMKICHLRRIPFFCRRPHRLQVRRLMVRSGCYACSFLIDILVVHLVTRSWKGAMLRKDMYAASMTERRHVLLSWIGSQSGCRGLWTHVRKEIWTGA